MYRRVKRSKQRILCDQIRLQVHLTEWWERQADNEKHISAQYIVQLWNSLPQDEWSTDVVWVEHMIFRTRSKEALSWNDPVLLQICHLLLTPPAIHCPSVAI